MPHADFGGHLALEGIHVRPSGAGASKMSADALKAAIAPYLSTDASIGNRVAFTLSQATEAGTIYTVEEIAELSSVAHAAGLKVHMDGARFSNAVAALGVTPAEMTWKAGIDILSLGGTKNGCWCAEAIVFFNPDDAAALPVLRKRAGHLMSKGRYAAAQILAMLDGDLWLDNARAANRAATTLADACGRERLVYPVEANELFVKMTADEATAIRAQGFDFYDWGPDQVRLVTSWDQDMDAVARLAAAIEAL